ncbi:MAG: phosphoribosylformylglycinamidine synthase subunit PurS [Chloroflexi bacterium]|nr:phosphoribosylformylglycinamidine synthase subunit PurS [Chloroflexota bacterium]GIW09232.1 MAG: phosphoribosylformylglycinamidine synthase subunit PurS [Dehalococcoidia bacterium]
MVWLAKIIVSLKPVVNDPPGLTIQSALHTLGFAGVQTVRSGKYFEVRLSASSEAAAREQVEQMCRQLLANPVIEEYRFSLEPSAA